MQKIGRYQIEHELGRGAMGVVYRAFDPAIGRRVAVKTIHLEQAADPQKSAAQRASLLREAQSAGILSHPNIVTIYDIAEDSANVYIFMEYVEGSTLDARSQGMPVGEFLDLLHQAAVGLDYAHGKGIVHRDIKPANLMLSGNRLKVTDFGVARSLHLDNTQGGSLLGTPSYMAPEQISGGEASGATDQYSLAVIAYEFLAGAKPFESENLATLLFRIAHEAPTPIASLPPRCNDVLAQALAKDPGKRFASCTAFIDALSMSLGHVVQVETPSRMMTGDEPTLVAEPNVLLTPNLPPARKPLEDTPLPAPAAGWPKIMGSLGLLTILVGGGWYLFLRPVEEAVPAAGGTASVPQTPEAQKPSPVGEVTPPATVELKTNAEASKQEGSPSETVGSPKAAAVSTQPQREIVNAAGVHAVTFTSAPDGAEVLINDGRVDRCRATPCTLELPAGSYRVTGKQKDFPEVVRNLVVPGSKLLHLSFELAEGMLSINSNPSGAAIRLNGREILEKTPTMLKLKPGTYTLEIIKEGLPPQSREVTVSNGTVQSLSVKWN